jgi:hypothetical protein
MPEHLPMRLLRLFLLVSIMGIVASPLASQETTNQVWPEVDLFANLNSKLRASWYSAHSTDRDSNTTSWEFGPNLDIYLKSMRAGRSETPDESKRKYLVVRLGYRVLPSPNGTSEQRGIIEITPRYYLPKSFLLSDRNRLDLRGTNTFSWRYRNRITLERDLKVGRVAFTPYGRVEFFYNITAGNWERVAYTVGTVFPFLRHFEMEPYFERQVNANSEPKYVNGFGLTLSVYF